MAALLCLSLGPTADRRIKQIMFDFPGFSAGGDNTNGVL